MEQNVFLTKVIGIVIAAVVAAVVLVPIVSSATSTQIDVPGGENPNPVSDLRLAYTEEQDASIIVQVRLTWIESEDDPEEGVPAVNITTYLDVDMDTPLPAPPTPSYEITGVTGDVIIFASDYFSLIFKDGALIESQVGQAETLETGRYIIEVREGVIGGLEPLPYTFIYYPSADGEYANYNSYKYDSGDAFAWGDFQGMSFASKNGNIVGYSPFDVTSTSVTDNGEVVGVDFTVKAGDGTGTLPEGDLGGGGEISPIMG